MLEKIIFIQITMAYGNTVVPMNCYCSAGSCVVKLDRGCVPFYEINRNSQGFNFLWQSFTDVYLHIILSSLQSWTRLPRAATTACFVKC